MVNYCCYIKYKEKELDEIMKNHTVYIPGVSVRLASFLGVKLIAVELHVFFLTGLPKKRAQYTFFARISQHCSEPVTAARQFEFFKDVANVFVHRH